MSGDTFIHFGIIMKIKAFFQILSKSDVEGIISVRLYNVNEVHFPGRKGEETSPDSYRGYPLNYGAKWVCEFMNTF